MEEIVSFLIKEGYADDHKAASKIYEAMSDEWLESILCEAPRTKADRDFLAQRKRNFQTGKGPNWPYGDKKANYDSPSTGIVATGDSQSAPVRKKKKLTFEVK
jgi:hypothetical protein